MDRLEAVFAAQEALHRMLTEAPAFADVKVDLGYPYEWTLRHAWVSSNLSAEAKPIDSNLSLFEVEPHIGGGIAVRQFAGEDWSLVRLALRELVSALEAVVRGDRTLSGTCTGAYVSSLAASEQLEGSEVGLNCLFELDLRQYGQ